MLRRYEIYSVAPDAPADMIEKMAVAMRDCSAYIPEVLHSAIGRPQNTGNSLNFVWEHAYESPMTYQSYMAHPFHAAIFDRYLMNDSPERIVTDNPHGLGLGGYSCDSPVYFLPSGAVRRLVALNLKDGTEDQFAAIADAELQRSDMIQSVFKDNSFAARWFDGETVTGFDTEWSHLWEQGFESMEAALAYTPEWQAKAGDIVRNSLELVYTLETGARYDPPAS